MKFYRGFFIAGVFSLFFFTSTAHSASRARQPRKLPSTKPPATSKPTPTPAVNAAPKGPALQSLVIDPNDVTLVGAQARQAFIVMGQFSDGGLRDLTRAAKFRSLQPDVVQVSAEGVVTAVGDGVATVNVSALGSKATALRVTVKEAQAKPTVSFANEVVPVLSKAGCNQGACHGAQYGKGGFKLSLFGYDPAPDYEAIVKFGEGRRVTRSRAGQSLILLKPTMGIAHGGGLRFAADSLEYRTISRWIDAGCPTAQKAEPTVTKLEIIPRERVFTALKEQQQLLVRAHFSDGAVRDVTHLTRYDSLDDGVALVNQNGLVRATNPGESPIMARFKGVAVMARMTIPTQWPLPQQTFPAANNYVDTLVYKKLEKLGVTPSDLSRDEEFLRRVSLDITGTLPKPDEIRAFLKDTDPQKRAKKIDDLLERKDYVDQWAYRWSDLLRNNSGLVLPQGMKAFYEFIRKSVQENKPWNEFCAEIITAEGNTFQSGPPNFYRIAGNDNSIRAISAAQTFLGARIECAQCHKHPFETWTQDDFHAFAAIFAPVTLRQGSNNQQGFHYLNDMNRRHVNPRTGRAIVAKALDGPDVQSGADPRAELSKWLSTPDNPYFAKAAVNRVWKYLFGRGLVEPVDDLRQTNPASNEELFDALAKDFIAHKFDVKYLIRTICNSRTYQLSSQVNESNKKDSKNFSRAYLRRLGAEQLLDAISEATSTPESFNVPQFGIVNRAIALPDSRVPSYFLDVFGRPKRVTVCECERSEDANVAQALHMLSGTINQKLSSPYGRIARLLRDNLSDEQIIEEMYLSTLSRFPREEEIKAIKQDLAQTRVSKREAWEDWFWALMDSKEFLFNH
jgi:hypothetical protein